MVAKMFLTELASAIALIVQELGKAGGAGPQIGNRARNWRQNHTRAVRVHAGKERAAPSGTTRLSIVMHKHAAFLGNSVDVWGFAHHQAAMIAARLHPADIIAHDEQDVWFLVLCLTRRNRARQHG